MNYKHKKIYDFLDKNVVEICVIFFSILFSVWLMFSTFSYHDGNMIIATKAWSDFGSHIPLIRSFSLGFNFPPEYPLFPGEPIRYHYFFYLAVGFLEKIGVRIDIALNILSATGFSLLLLMIYFFAKRLFSSKAVAVLSIIFFLFNGSLSFLYFIKNNLDADNFIYNIVNNNSFPSFGPYDGNVISAFWNLNIYTNQRHLAFALALSLFAIYVFITPLYKKKVKRKHTLALIMGAILGLSFYFHLAILLSTLLIVFCLSVLFKKLRVAGLIVLVTAGVISLPQYLYMRGVSLEGSGIQIKLGYLSQTEINFSIYEFITYWIANFGVHSVLILVAFFLTNSINKRLLLSFSSLFVLGNVLQFSSETAANHKFFNYFMIIGVMYSAFTIVKFLKGKFLGKIFAPFIILVCIFSGIIDFFPIYNDSKITIADYPKDKDIAWILENTPKDAVFLNSNYFNSAPSLAGRKIFLGWPYFAWSAGHDTETRDSKMRDILLSDNPKNICKFLNENNLDYVYLKDNINDFSFDKDFWSSHFDSDYTNEDNQLYIYSKKEICSKSNLP